ncbi:phosphoribosylformylglycinamidine synthase [Salinibacter ruber]|jgi:phosphoribosylformylglycinamidine synthase|uniref:Phosphoribosylformylglycinamidine synthase subunit PurS n=3 Tax=Salinibacter ruber TaxID=146919 RepID=Q2S3Y6_SALRD|nr:MULTISPECIES: phosphoribosylformylglycinamidine synthase subunit PurS [Salinibacter]ABC45681.1 Phosphoribosylformylglycinamidine (FGAM) synthase [Salinibacter ruber DSM 13855]MBB4061449.1 phosphoribosylformylglycinamidine synthase [Salinibacter ruber]MBB4067820.1 phosphoribosylformylglycinamidine synthase [Salinibacter ruber]MBB4090216.1 phosphoribosylformylglycinamidine synthase [Salinibacter ruber]MCS3612304.1 phosphoribosylformylglycinamidine synthase [Salinibacter ruber]
MYKATISITLRPSILDPEGKTIQHALTNLGYDAVDQVRMGKQAEVWIDAASEAEAREVATEACEKLLANPVTENFEIQIESASREAVGEGTA